MEGTHGHLLSREKGIHPTAQPIHRSPDSSYYHLGSDRVGADLAEKDALFWSALWKLSINSSIPTCFRSDSTVLSHKDMYCLIRTSSRIWAVTARLAYPLACVAFFKHWSLSWTTTVYSMIMLQVMQGNLGMNCVTALHNKKGLKERAKSFHFLRPILDFRKWKTVMPHIWMLLSQHDGLPQRHGRSLHVPPPNLPTAKCPDLTQPSDKFHSSQVKLTLSFCTANVNSLHRAPDGHEGKVQYLGQQMR